ncbi:MAG TPA: hypothetical protein VFC25_06985 [Verrucomicrobiae bacterium]|nr:hypothetical protein [Verrucomicrobiae bacterium]
MSTQVVSTDFWEAQLPEDWVHKEAEPSQEVYFEAPDHTAGVYISTWRIADESLQKALQTTRAVELKHLPAPRSGFWQVVSSTPIEDTPEIDARAEYFNRADQYRIVSRLLGRGDKYIRVTFHDYGCSDRARSARRSEPIVDSFMLRGQSVTC